MSDEDAWRELARATGLDLGFVVEASVNSANSSFQALEREMRQAMAHAGSSAARPWLHGKYGEISIIVHSLPLKLLARGTVGKADEHNVVIAEVDPPLFAGLRMISRNLCAFLGQPSGEQAIGHHALDPPFLTYAHDIGRVREVFLPHGNSEGLDAHVAHAHTSCSFVIKDSSVGAITRDAVPTREQLEASLDIATSIARMMSIRSRDVTQTALEIEARAAWHRLAAKLGLSIDPLRWHIFGTLRDVEVSVQLEGSPPGVSTTFRARFRQPLPCSLFLRRGSNGMPPGFPELDKLFVLKTNHLDQARAALADGAVRLALAREAQWSNVVLDDREIVLGRGGFASTREISARLDGLVELVDRMTPPMHHARPFR